MKYLPIEIEINGVTYYSGLELASRELDSYNLGVAVGKKEGYETGMDEGYKKGYEQCKHDGISKINLNTEPVEQTELSKEYDKGFTKGYEEGLEEGKKTNDYQTYKMGYEAGKKAKRYTEDDINQSHTDMNHINHLWYDKGYNTGKVEGYKNGYTIGFDNGLDSATIANTTAVKPSPCNHGECIASNEEEYDKGYYAGWEDGKNHIMQFI